MSYTSVANQYVTSVISGEVLACRWVKLAAKRHTDDLQKSKDPSYPYRFDPKKAERACKFIELLPHTKGRWAAKRELLKLQPWQVFIVCNIFGWVHKTSGLRKYREAYICIPRKNGKSPLAAAIGLYMLAADGECGAEVYTGATSEAQAWEVFRPARLMAEKTTNLQSRLGVVVNAKSLTIPGNGSRFLPVIGKPGDGASPSCGICDEFHEADSADLYDTFKTGMVGREQPLLLVITTAGVNTSSPCHLLQIDAQKVLEGVALDEQLFVIIFTVDADVDWSTETALRMANPNYEVSVTEEALKRLQSIAMSNSAKRNIFLTKHLNVWCSASAAWIPIEKWNACGDFVLSDEFNEADCFIGLDLASKVDIAAAVKLFRKQIDGVTHYYVSPRFYLPEECASAPESQHYQKFVHDEHLITTPGNVIDYGRILSDLVEDTKQYHVQELAFDQWGAEYLRQQFAEETGVTTAQVPQTPKYLSDPAKELEALVVSGRFHHDNNPAMSWMIANVVAKYDNHDNLVLSKDKRENKIDGVDALLNALFRALASAPQESANWFTPFVLD